MAPKAQDSTKGFAKRFFAGKYSPSILSEIEVETAGEKFGLPEGYVARVAEKNELPQKADQKDLCVYQDQVRLGLTFSKLEVLADILNLVQISLAMLTPNMVFAILTLHRFCQLNNITWSTDIFFHLFSLKSFSYYVAYRSRKKTFSIYGTESSIHDWKMKYFYIQSPNGWNIPVVPGYPNEDAAVIPKCPPLLRKWLDEHPMDQYVLFTKTCSMLTPAEIMQINDKRIKDKNNPKPSEGKKVVSKPPPAKKQKITKVIEKPEASQKVTNVDTNFDSSSSDSDSTHTSDSSKSSASIDITTEENLKKTKAEELNAEVRALEGEPSREKTTVDSEDEGPQGYFINPAGNLEIEHDCDIPVLLEPYNDFGVNLAKFTRSKKERASLAEIPHHSLMQLFHSSTLSADRIGGYLSESAVHWKDCYDKMQTSYDEARKKNEDLEEEIRTRASTSGIAADQIKSLEIELTSVHGMITTISDQNKSLTAENDYLKSSSGKKDTTITELSSTITEKNKKIELLEKQLEERPSTSEELSIEEQFKRIVDSDPYTLAMVKFMQDGFEKFRRAMLRQTQDQVEKSKIEAVDFFQANVDEEVDEDDDDE